uniref:Golgi associated RAB2 interactor protein-like Rab2B-binding domain-containing protein n=1 Tax=Laticauda laticaudata TaxID=8630 RepID=A0A8C5WTN1_LATLA
MIHSIYIDTSSEKQIISVELLIIPLTHTVHPLFVFLLEKKVLFNICFWFPSSQVTRKGRHVFIHNSSNEAIIGIASTNSKLPLPNLMFIARPVAEQVSSSDSQAEELTLTRLLPLKFVRISIYNPRKQLIKIQLINGRSYYLQFQASTKEEEALFERWLSLVYLLHHPPSCYLTAQPTSCTVTDSLSIQIIPSEEEIVRTNMDLHSLVPYS